jgi:hypothetical protein
MLQAQTLWDSTMAWKLFSWWRTADAATAAAHLRHGEGGRQSLPPLVLHVCGKFHCEGGLGIPEHLHRYQREVEAAPGASLSPAPRVVTVVMFPESGHHTFVRDRHQGLADYVVLTDEAVPPSFQVNHPI